MALWKVHTYAYIRSIIKLNQFFIHTTAVTIGGAMASPNILDNSSVDSIQFIKFYALFFNWNGFVIGFVVNLCIKFQE